jgi:hypothetical protein
MSGTGACWRDKEAATAAAARSRSPSPTLFAAAAAAAAAAVGGAGSTAAAAAARPPTDDDLLLLLRPPVPKRLLRTSLGPQVLSSHVTAPAASFGSGEQRPRSGSGAGSGGGSSLSPRRAGLGPQVESTRPTAPSSGFGTGERQLGGVARPSKSHPPTPGPGAYGPSTTAGAAGAADLALIRRSAPRVRFASAPRDAARRAAEPDPVARRGGAGPCGGNAESPPPGAYTPLGAMGGRQPTRPSAPGVRFGGGRGGGGGGAVVGGPSAATAAVPGVGEYSSGAAVAALNLVSIHRSAPAHSFGGRAAFGGGGGFGGGVSGGRSGSGRGGATPDASASRGGSSNRPPSRSGPGSSPGPSDTAPPLAAASARQVLSTRPNAPTAGFGGGARRPGMGASGRGVPGPGTYDA